MRKLSKEVRDYIDSLNDPLYTGDFCAEWYDTEEVFTPEGLMVEGFVRAICAVMASEKTKCVSGKMKTIEG